MIPKLTQDAPNILAQYRCGSCDALLKGPNGGWHFCPSCGEKIEYDKAEPIHWKTQCCEQCGRALILPVPGMTDKFMPTGDYVGSHLCGSCMEAHCMKTGCLQCKIGRWPGCQYHWIKQQAIQKL